MKKIFPYLLSAFIWIQCGDLDRNNPLDPKNSNSYVDRNILVELFVNDSTGYDYCNYALNAIENLSQHAGYEDNLFVLEYHLINRNSVRNDTFASEEFNQRYYQYVLTASDRGVPDAMFNGLSDRVQGASLENISNRYTAAAEAFLGQKAYFGIEAEKKINGNSIELHVTVARYGRSDQRDIDLHVVLYEDLGISRYRFVVRSMFQKETIPIIKKGEVKSFTFTKPLSQLNNINNLYALIFLQDREKANREIYQVAKF